MSLRTYILLMCLSTLLAWTAWGFVVMNVQPVGTGAIGPGLFYVTLFVSLIGSFTLIDLLARLVLFKQKGADFREVRISFRHAVLLSFLAVIALFLSSGGWLTWWAWIILIVVASAIEGLFLLAQSGRR